MRGKVVTGVTTTRRFNNGAIEPKWKLRNGRPMVRTVLALLTLLALSAPAIAVEEPPTASYSASAGCRAPVVALDVPGCRVAHTGVVTLVDCAGNACNLTLSGGASATGLLPGKQDIASAILADARVAICSAGSVTTSGAALACEGDAAFTVNVPAACRLLLVETTVTVNGAVKGASYSELRVCKSGTLTAL